MLTLFTCERYFYNVKAVLAVDVIRKEVSFYVTKEMRIVPASIQQEVHFEYVRTPEAADEWLADRIEGIWTALNP